MNRAIFLCCLWALVAGGRLALANVIVQHPWLGEPNGVASRLQRQIVADDFALQSPASIAAMTWMGVNTPEMGNPPPPPLGSTVPFQIRFYTDVPQPPSQQNRLNHRPSQSPFV